MNKKTHFKEVSIEEFIEAIQKLPANDHRDEWLRWLKGYDTPGPFDRKMDKEHDARYVYNHLAYPEMLLWLIQASGVNRELAKLAEDDSHHLNNVRQQTAAIRKHVPWEVVERALWRSS